MTNSVVAAYYESPAQAQRTLQSLPVNGELVDAAVMVGDEAGRLKLLSERVQDGALEEIFPGSVLNLKATGREADKAQDHFVDHGFHKNLLKEIGENLPPGGAALVTVIEERWLTGFREMVGAPLGFERYA
ncbi:MAG TPA: hypothetical protein VFY54_00755, partial [Rubrobacter sp.]|nr:hypothetical protein [Rubrobacter sp.]